MNLIFVVFHLRACFFLNSIQGDCQLSEEFFYSFSLSYLIESEFFLLQNHRHKVNLNVQIKYTGHAFRYHCDSYQQFNLQYFFRFENFMQNLFIEFSQLQRLLFKGDFSLITMML